MTACQQLSHDSLIYAQASLDLRSQNSLPQLCRSWPDVFVVLIVLLADWAAGGEMCEQYH